MTTHVRCPISMAVQYSQHSANVKRMEPLASLARGGARRSHLLCDLPVKALACGQSPAEFS